MPEQMVLNVNGTEYPLTSSDTVVELNSLPGYFRGRSLPMTFTANYYNTIETNISLPFSLGKTVDMQLQRDSTFAVYAGVVVDEDGNRIPDVLINCEDIEVNSDEDGAFYLSIPLEKQTTLKTIVLQKNGYEAIEREDESPNRNLYYLIRKK